MNTYKRIYEKLVEGALSKEVRQEPGDDMMLARGRIGAGQYAKAWKDKKGAKKQGRKAAKLIAKHRTTKKKKVSEARAKKGEESETSRYRGLNSSSIKRRITRMGTAKNPKGQGVEGGTNIRVMDWTPWETKQGMKPGRSGHPRRFSPELTPAQKASGRRLSQRIQRLRKEKEGNDTKHG